MTDQQTDRKTDGPTDRRTDRPTDGHDLHIYATSRRIKTKKYNKNQNKPLAQAFFKPGFFQPCIIMCYFLVMNH